MPRFRSLQLAAACAVAVLAGGTASFAQRAEGEGGKGGAFSIAVVPDTQNMIDYKHQRASGFPFDASELFPRVTTWLGFPRDMVLRGYMVDFVHLFAPHYSPRLIRDAARAQTQEEVDQLFQGVALPIKGGCELEEQRTARTRASD